MTTSKPSNWSKPSRACRIELRRSRLLAATIAAIGVLGVPSWWLSDAPRPLALGAAAAGLAWALLLARREARRERVMIALQASGAVQVDADTVDGLDVAWRGPLLTLAWRSRRGRVRRFVFPDALDATARRELRLWALQRREDAPPAAVAP